MYRIYYILMIVILVSCKSSETNVLEHEIQTAKTLFAPDKRVAIFDIQAKKTASGTIKLLGETNLPKALALFKEKLDPKLSIIDSVTILPSKELGNANFGVVNISVGNIRSNPKHSAELATQALMGMPLKIYKKQDNWYYVQTPDHYLGWLDAGGFTQMKTADFNNWEALDKIIFTKDFGYVYDLNTNGIVSDAVLGNKFAVVSKNKDRFTVQFPDGRTGWVSTTDAMEYTDWILSRHLDEKHILETAKLFMGRPYLWGGTSSKAMDCSGFTKMVYFSNGIELARDASQQVKQGVSVKVDANLKDLKKGDLLFFGSAATAKKKERIWHVAIYLGDGQIIHASGAIKIQSLRPEDDNFAKERLNTLLKARRIIGTPMVKELTIKA